MGFVKPHITSCPENGAVRHPVFPRVAGVVGEEGRPRAEIAVVQKARLAIKKGFRMHTLDHSGAPDFIKALQA